MAAAKSIYDNQEFLGGLANMRANPEEDPLGGKEGFHTKLRTLDIAIQNKTSDTNLRLVDEYFKSGAWFVSPKPVNIPAQGMSIGYAASRKLSLVGVNGGLMYEAVKVQGQETCTRYMYLYIGFENPVIGTYKTFINISDKKYSAEWACKQARNGDDTTKNEFEGQYNALAQILPPKVSKYRLFRFTFGSDDITSINSNR